MSRVQKLIMTKASMEVCVLEAITYHCYFSFLSLLHLFTLSLLSHNLQLAPMHILHCFSFFKIIK